MEKKRFEIDVIKVKVCSYIAQYLVLAIVH